MTLVNHTVTYEVEDAPFFYLAGPMTEVADHNFHEFRRVEARLKFEGMTIVSPYDLKSQPAPSEGGNPPASTTPEGLELLRRDVNIVMDPNCVGIILLPGWEESFGAGVETFIGEAWSRPLHAYREDENGNPSLVLIESRQGWLERYRLREAFDKMMGVTTMRGRAAGELER